jgi:hypothetical protein
VKWSWKLPFIQNLYLVIIKSNENELREIRICNENISTMKQVPSAHAGSSLADFSTLKMEAMRSSEMSVNTRSTLRHISEDGILHSHRCENLKSYIFLLLCDEHRRHETAVISI